MDYAAEFRRCLETCDVPGARKLWAHVQPNLPQPKSDHDALVTIHHARTAANSVAFKLRAYSHAWLLDHGLPSGLPDHLKSKAEQICPRVVSAVGISVNVRSEWMKPAIPLVRKAMSDAVLDVYADGRQDDIPLVRERMNAAKDKEFRKLFGHAL